MVVDQYAKSVEKCEVVTWVILFQANEQIASQKTKNSEQEEFYKVKKRTMDLLPDAENNIAKLQVFSSIHVKKNFFSGCIPFCPVLFIYFPSQCVPFPSLPTIIFLS